MMTTHTTDTDRINADFTAAENDLCGRYLDGQIDWGQLQRELKAAKQCRDQQLAAA